ncbi:MAG: hypothetical protein IPQ13_06510 [Holophagaceae bacterium]|nr:hypothetical protein [Holophagaceae bacterium]
MPRTFRPLFAALLLSFSTSLVGQIAQDSGTPAGPVPQALTALMTPPVVPTGSLTTLFAGNNSQNGNMFDVQTINKITITSFAINLSTSYPSTTMEVYYKAGTSVGFETNAGAWTLLGSSVVTSLGDNVPTPLPVGGLTLDAGQVYAFYITSTSPIGFGVIRYTNGTTDYSNSDLTIYHGFGKAYPFANTFSPRIWNGTIFYNIIPAYDTSFLDDSGNSLICFSSVTGDFQWNVLAGPNAGNTYTGTSRVTQTRMATKLATPFGVFPSLNLYWNTIQNSATATLAPTVQTTQFDPYFRLSDANTTNNPPSPCLPALEVRSLSTPNN